MFLRMQDFDFAQIQSNLPKSWSLLPKFHPYLSKFYRNLPKFTQVLPKSNQFCLKNFAGGCGCIPSSYGTGTNYLSVNNLFQKVYQTTYSIKQGFSIFKIIVTPLQETGVSCLLSWSQQLCISYWKRFAVTSSCSHFLWNRLYKAVSGTGYRCLTSKFITVMKSLGNRQCNFNFLPITTPLRAAARERNCSFGHGGPKYKILSFVLTPNYQSSVSNTNFYWEWGLTHFLVIEYKWVWVRSSQLPVAKGFRDGASSAWRFLIFITITVHLSNFSGFWHKFSKILYKNPNKDIGKTSLNVFQFISTSLEWKHICKHLFAQLNRQ